MRVYVDTSAILAVLDADDANHQAAKVTWATLLESRWDLTMNNYVLVEAAALIQHRLGLDALRAFADAIQPVLAIDWIDAPHHEAAMQSVLIAGRRRLSLVDCSSFISARKLGITTAFAFDAHFLEQGFTCLPAPGPLAEEDTTRRQ